VEKRILPLRDLRTIRKGEIVFDPVFDGILSTEQEIIHIAAKPGTRVCMYFQEDGNRCAIYETRPLECRVLKCWDTRDIEYWYRRDRLSRESVIRLITGLMELVEAHEERCSVSDYMVLLRSLEESPSPEAGRRVREMISFDREFRRLTVEKSHMDPGILPFLFGVPLTELRRPGGKSYRNP
jgi:Fe-S-cluster containining protein